MTWSVREAVELFHLAFLVQLGVRLGKDRFVIKGGCNLRFFFNSVRYSEDLDLDVETVSRGTLKKATEQVLQGRALAHTLGAAGIELGRVTAPKQTDTTQRFKVAFAVDGVSAHTKVEFSRRGTAGETTFEQASPTLTMHYGLTPLLARHYTRGAAIRQKVGALIGRARTQARDVFDLNLLLTEDVARSLVIDEEARRAAIERAMSVDFDAFQSQVVAYLAVELQEHYASREVWEQMVLRVVEMLGGSPDAH